MNLRDEGDNQILILIERQQEEPGVADERERMEAKMIERIERDIRLKLMDHIVTEEGDALRGQIAKQIREGICPEDREEVAMELRRTASATT
jgi:hypothetical protein